MNIKNPEAHRLAQELSSLTGESLTETVTTALRERLEKLRRGRGDMAARLLAIGRECAPRIAQSYRETSHGDLLYDDKGLPR